MNVISARNAHQALPEALYRMSYLGRKRDSRNGPVLVADGPVTTLYRRPTERVVFWPQRDANPFFHLFEALWMLSGRNDVAFPAQFAGQIARYSDDGTILHGAYGHRWRRHFAHPASDGSSTIIDQLWMIAEALRRNPDDRRQVLAMWDPSTDLGRDGKDLPCNTHAYFTMNEGALDVTVCCRSNDIVWGCYGANAVHFSVLLEYVAALVGAPVGRYWQVSNNWHLYLEQHESLLDELSSFAVMPPAPRTCPYSTMGIEPRPMIEIPDRWDAERDMFLEEGTSAGGYQESFFRRVAIPMLTAWQTFRSSKDPGAPLEAAEELSRTCKAKDWALGGYDWLMRRHLRRKG